MYVCEREREREENVSSVKIYFISLFFFCFLLGPLLLSSSLFLSSLSFQKRHPLSLFSPSSTRRKNREFSAKKRDVSRLHHEANDATLRSLSLSFLLLFLLSGDFRSENRSIAITRRSERFIEDRIGRGRARPSKQTRNGKGKKKDSSRKRRGGSNQKRGRESDNFFYLFSREIFHFAKGRDVPRA